MMMQWARAIIGYYFIPKGTYSCCWIPSRLNERIIPLSELRAFSFQFRRSFSHFFFLFIYQPIADYVTRVSPFPLNWNTASLRTVAFSTWLVPAIINSLVRFYLSRKPWLCGWVRKFEDGVDVNVRSLNSQHGTFGSSSWNSWIHLAFWSLRFFLFRRTFCVFESSTYETPKSFLLNRRIFFSREQLEKSSNLAASDNRVEESNRCTDAIALRPRGFIADICIRVSRVDVFNPLSLLLCPGYAR